MRIISWNLNGLLASLKNNNLIALSKLKPDIICFQEIRTQTEPEIIAGFHHYWNHGQYEGYSGTALLSVNKPQKILIGFMNNFQDTEGRIITAEYNDYYVVNVYVPNSQKNLKRHAYRMEWDKALQSHVKILSEEKAVIICGDFNVARDDIDIYPENIHSYLSEYGFVSDERSNFETLLEDGFEDVFRVFFPNERSYTWWSNRLRKRDENRGWRLDYFLISADLINSVKKITHLSKLTGSDHCPIMLEI